MSQRINIRMLVCVGFAALGNIVVAEQPGTPMEGIVPGYFLQAMPEKGVWSSLVQEPIDGDEMIPVEQRIVLTADGQKLQGYNYLNLGYKFTGEFIPGTPPLLMLRHEQEVHPHDRRREFVSLYVGKQIAPNRFVGTWFNNAGLNSEWTFELVADVDGKPTFRQPGGPDSDSDASGGPEQPIGEGFASDDTVAPSLQVAGRPRLPPCPDQVDVAGYPTNDDASSVARSPFADRSVAVDLLPLVLARLDAYRDLKGAEAQAANLEDGEAKEEFLAGKRKKLELLDLIVKAEKSAAQAVIALAKQQVKHPPNGGSRDFMQLQLRNAQNRLAILERLTQ